MTNIDRAAGIIRAMVEIENPTHDTDVAQALADATPPLLMPDLPVPDQDGRLWTEHDFNYAYVQSPRFTGTGNIIIIARGAGPLALTREEALELASLLTAAAMEEA